MIAEQALEALARTHRIARQHDLVLRLAQGVDMAGDGFVDVGAARPLGGEIARRLDREIDDLRAFGLVEGRDEMERALADHLLPFAAREVERLRRQRLVAAGLAALRLLPV